MPLVANGTTQVPVPTQAELVDAAVEMSRVLRTARVEAPARPKVIGALVLALYEADGRELADAPTCVEVDRIVARAVGGAGGLADDHRAALVRALDLAGAHDQQLDPHLGQLVAILRRLRVREVLHGGVDFLGAFYEAFLRYGHDNNALGIVFTPRHVTALCADLAEVDHGDEVIDIACGTGGFLVSAFDRMLASAPTDADRDAVPGRIRGFDTNPTVWALAVLNMYFRGTGGGDGGGSTDGSGHGRIQRGSSLADQAREAVRRRHDVAFLNPPFSQHGEPEHQFLDAAMEALRPGGVLVAVVKAGIFADDRHRDWRGRFTEQHTIEAVVSLPDDLFYPTAAPTSILVARAHAPQPADAPVLLARIANDGFEKLKGRRVERPGSELPAVLDAHRRARAGQPVQDDLATTVAGGRLCDGAEWSPQQWLPQPAEATDETERLMGELAGSILRSVSEFPDLGDAVLDDFTAPWSDLPTLPYGGPPRELRELFEVVNGRSRGEKNYPEGVVAYVSSGDPHNSIVGLVAAEPQELFADGGITVTAFGQAHVQPWPFLARGNGGSSVRVLTPRWRMTVRELLWFAAQVNTQRWRFLYARMAIKTRIERLQLSLPPHELPDGGHDLARTIRDFQATFDAQRVLLAGQSS